MKEPYFIRKQRTSTNKEVSYNQCGLAHVCSEWKEPYLTLKEPYLKLKEPYFKLKEPYFKLKEPCIIRKQRTSTNKETII